MTKRVDLKQSKRGDEDAAQSNSRNTYIKMLRPNFRKRCDTMLEQLVQEFYASYEPARRLLDPTFFSHDFFVRSTIESVLRIDLMRRVNPLVCNKVAAADPALCKQWGLYAADEGLHGRMFAKDLHAAGVDDEQIYSTPYLFATELLSGYLYHTLEEEGALGVIASAYYVESVADMTQPGWLENMEKHIGARCTKGARAHLQIDEKEDHADLAWNMCMRLVQTPEDDKRLVQHILKLHSLLCAYVVEVLEMTVVNKEQPEAAPGMAAKMAVQVKGSASRLEGQALGNA